MLSTALQAVTSEIAAARADVVVDCPADGREVGRVPDCSPAEVTAAAARLRNAQPEWEALGAAARGQWLGRLRDWILDHERALAGLLQDETGKARHDAVSEVTATLDVINYYAKNAERFLAEQTPRPHSPLDATKRLRTIYRPHQLVGVITPWNFPLLVPIWDVVPALMAGCAVLTKPSEVTPLAWREIVRAWREDLGAPDVLGCVTGLGATGATLVDEVDYIQFTGSAATGRKIAQRAGERLIPCSLELGGKDPMIVLADADLQRAVNGAAWGGLANSGQLCVSVERVYVEAPVYDEFVARLVQRVRKLRQGPDDQTYKVDIGAMATEAQREVVRRHVEDALANGARALTGGRAREDGLFFEPTVLVDVDHSMACMREETFGPTIPVMKVADADEAVRLANDSPYGLSASVWTTDRAKGELIARRLDVGAVNINNVATNLFALPVPHSGWKESGIGARLGAGQAVHKYCRTQVIASERIELSAEPHWYPYTARKGRIAARAARLLLARDWRRRLTAPTP
jgi:acyl-CoA reductase-like NAD-dependent aldehyde dehydrogenase